jgi:hypothetical protein
MDTGVNINYLPRCAPCAYQWSKKQSETPTEFTIIKHAQNTNVLQPQPPLSTPVPSWCIQSLLPSEYGPPNRAINPAFSFSLIRSSHRASASNSDNGVILSALSASLPSGQRSTKTSPHRCSPLQPSNAKACSRSCLSPLCPQATGPAKTSPHRSSPSPPPNATAFSSQCPRPSHLLHAAPRVPRCRDCAVQLHRGAFPKP